MPSCEFTVGVLRPVGCVSVANDGDSTLAMLVRRRDETLVQLLTPGRPGYRQGLQRRDLHRRDQPAAHKLETLAGIRTLRQDATAGRLRKICVFACQSRAP